MPRHFTIEQTAYQFDELDDSAKEKARQWYRDGTHIDSELRSKALEAAR